MAGSDAVALVPLKPGTYLVRARDNSGNLGPVASVVTKGAQVLPFAPVMSLTADPGWIGTGVNVAVEGGASKLVDIGAEGRFGPRAREYQSLGCRAGDAWVCAEIGKRALRNGIGPEAREAGVAFDQRACELGQYHCDDAKAVRGEDRVTIHVERKDGSVEIHQQIVVGRDTQRAIVLGKGGSRIKAIGEAARAELTDLLGRKVHLFLHVKVSENWSEDKEIFEEIGLDWVR